MKIAVLPRLFLALALLAGAVAAQAQPIFRITAIPDESPTELARKAAPLARYLERKLGVKVEFTPVTDYAAAVEALAHKQVDLAWLGGFTFVQASQRSGGKVVPLVQREEDEKFRSVFITTDPGIRSLADLKGRNLSFGSQSSTSGHLMPRSFLLQAGVGPVIAWRRASARNLRRSFTVPLALGFVTGIVIFAAGWRNYYAVVCFSISAFVLATIFMEFYRGTRARQALMGEAAPQALANLIGKNRRRYGGYVIHVGVVMVFIGVAASSAFRLEEQETIKKGDVVTIGAFALTYKDIHFTDGAHYSSMLAEIEVRKNGAVVETLYPEKRFYKKQQQPTTEVALRSTLLEDLYLVLGSYDDKSELMTMIVFVNPLVNWLWIGGLVMVLGTVIVMSPTAAEQRALAAALAVEDRGLEAALR